jgi:uncharacterized membrane protein
MTYFWLGALLFAGPHLFSTLLPGARNRLRDGLGRKAFQGIYALLSFLAVGSFVLGYRAMTETPATDALYETWAQGRHAVMSAMLLAFILIGASHGKGHIKAWLHHPMSLGVALWAGAHLLANSERGLVVMFSTFLVVALADLVFSIARGKRPSHTPQLKSDIRAVVIGVVLFAIFAFLFHPYVVGIPVVG